MNENHKQEIFQAILHNINNGQPIKFTFWFGGYKLYSLFPFPEVDWADFFAISYYCQYISPILLVYPPGVDFTFMLDSKILTKINNISLDEINIYQNSFQKLLKEFSVFFPKNLKLNVQKSSDLYSDSEFEEKFQESFEKEVKNYENLDKKSKEALLRSSEKNIKFNGVQNLTYLQEAEKKANIKWAAIAHEAYCNMSKLHEFVSGKQKEKIYLNTVPYRNAIAIGSTKNSVTTFWTGVGILEEIEIGKYKDWIVNPSQLTELLKYGYAEENLDFFSEKSLRNLKKIKITNRDFFLHIGRY